MMARNVITRRDFLYQSSSAACFGALYIGLPTRSNAEKQEKSKVVLIRDEDAVDKYLSLNEDILVKMLDEAICRLVGKENALSAWQILIKPNDTVGIKTNVWRYLRTPEKLESAIEGRLRDCGVKESNISFNDRSILKDGVFNRATALINIRPMRTHAWSGVGSLIKNYIMFDPNPSSYHSDSCADLAKIWYHPEVKNKTRLNILVMLTPLFHGVGPHHYSREYVWAYKGLLVSTDPVAADATGVRILQEKRREYFGEEKPINPPPKHVFLADTRHHLGTADPDKIDLIRIGWEKDILI